MNEGEKQFSFTRAVPSTSGRTKKQLLITSSLTVCVLLWGCSIPFKQGATTHHLVLGIGIVSTYESTNQPVTVTRVQALGAYVANQPGLKFGLGACSSTAVTVSTNAEDVRVEVRARPASLIVDTASATVRPIQPEPR